MEYPAAAVITAIYILTGLAVGLGATLLSAIIPAIRATTVPPVAALGEVALDRSATSTARKVAGPALIAGGVALIALALTGSGEATMWASALTLTTLWWAGRLRPDLTRS